MTTVLSVGCNAPEFVVRAERGTLAPVATGRPRVLAFLRRWQLDEHGDDELRLIRAELRGLGAELVVLSDAGVWSFRPDDDVDQLCAYSDRLAGDLATAALLYGVRDGRNAIFVIDEDGVIRFVHRAPARLHAPLSRALAAATDALLAPPPFTMTRRAWVTSCLVAGFALALLGCKQNTEPEANAAPDATPAPVHEIDIVLDVNGKRYSLRVEPRVSLLDALRERLGLTGTKKGCDMGQCGACTVLVDGKRVVSCLALAVMAQGKAIVTIEGLANGDELHPVQAAFVEHDGLQCGYCTPGQIMSAVALLAEAEADGGRTLDEAAIRERMSGNICRCGAYPNIVAAIRTAQRGHS
jgi:xanthine dehydrogenase YagT iron-sulfur-binding subunit